jgi:hypothetical protein
MSTNPSLLKREPSRKVGFTWHMFAQFYTLLLLLFDLSYLLLVIIPFYGNGLFAQRASAIRNQVFDPYSFAPFNWEYVGITLHSLAVASFFFVIFAVPVISLALAVSVAVLWRKLPLIGKTIYASVAATSLLISISAVTVSQLAFTWLMD